MPSPIQRPKWFTCFSAPDACSDPALCTLNCTQWESPFEDLRRYAAFEGDDVLPRDYRKCDSMDLDEAREIAESRDSDPLMKKIAEQLIARHEREQAELAEFRKRLDEPHYEARRRDQAQAQSDQLPE